MSMLTPWQPLTGLPAPTIWLAPLLIGLILWLLIYLLRAGRLRFVYEKHFPETPRERLFLAALGFFVAIGVIRLLTYAIHNHIGPFHDIQMRGRHIHHLVWGILLLLLVGYGWLVEVGTGESSSATWLGRAMAMI